MAVTVRCRYPFPRQVDGLYFSEEETDVPQQLAEGVDDVRGREFPGGDFMKHWGKEEKVLAADEDDFDARITSERLLQTQCGVHAAKAPAENHNALSRASCAPGAVPEKLHGNLLVTFAWRHG